MLQVLAFEQLFDEARPAVGGAQHVDEAHDVLAGDACRGARLALEARELIGLAREIAVKHLDREAELDAQVLGLVEPRHAAFAEHAHDAVGAAEHLADQRIARPRDLVGARRGVARAQREVTRVRAAARRAGPRGGGWFVTRGRHDIRP